MRVRRALDFCLKRLIKHLNSTLLKLFVFRKFIPLLRVRLRYGVARIVQGYDPVLKSALAFF